MVRRLGTWSAQFFALLGGALITALSPPVALAGGSARDHYWEFSGGLSRAAGASAFYGAGASDSQGPAPYFSLGIEPCLYHGFVRVYAGVQARYHLYPDGAILAAYPAIELGIWRMFLGAGYTPLVWRGGSHPDGGSANFLQGGFIVPITPEISLNLVVTREQASVTATVAGETKSVASPSSILSYGLGFRLYFGGGPAFGAGGGGGSGTFRGYRYPLGYGGR